MAWLDDRIWCHEKFTDVSPSAAWLWVKSVTYSSGMHTRGKLTIGQQKLVGSTPRARAELIAAGLWDINGDGSTITIHDWNEHNEKRDERRARDRVRKKEARASAGTSAGQSPGRSPGRSTPAAHVDGSEGSEGKNPNPTQPSELDQPVDLDFG